MIIVLRELAEQGVSLRAYWCTAAQIRPHCHQPFHLMGTLAYVTGKSTFKDWCVMES